MLNRIIRFSLHNRLLILLAAVLLMVAGLYTARTMDVDVFPDLNAPTVVVMTEAPGMAPEEVERLVTFPLETAVNGASHVRRVRSSSTTGFSVVWVEFDWGTDIWQARQTVAERTQAIGTQLPQGVGTPTLGPQSSILGELMFVSLTADSTSLQDLRTLADWTLRPRLLATGGVAQVAVLGGDVREYQICLDPRRMKHYGVSLTEVQQAVRGMNANAAGGVMYEYGNEYIVRGMLATRSVDQLATALVKNTPSGPVLLRHIADVHTGNRSPRTGVASLDGKPCVMLTVTKQPGTSTLDLSEKIDLALDELRPTLPADVQTRTDVYRQERFIHSAIGNVKQSLLEGGVFVVIVLFLFLMNVRTTVISLVTIPLSLVVALLTLHLMGLTINTMSLGGMAIAIGSLVDDAIVDVENVFKRLRENRLLPAGERRPARTVIYEASREVRLPILYSTLIIIASFTPLFFLSGMEGRLLVPLGIAFIAALAASTLVALTLTPVLCSFLLGSGKGSAPSEPRVTRWLRLHYEGLLRPAMRHPRWVLGGTGVLLAGALVAFTQLGRSFLPPFNEGSFTVNVTTRPGISLAESDSVGRRVEQLLLGVPEIRTVGRKTGRAELDEHALGVNTSEIEAPFVLDKRPRHEVMADIRTRLASVPGVNVEVGAPITHRIDAMLSGTQASIAIKVFGDDLSRMYSTAQQVKQAIEGIEGLADLNVEQQVERPQLQIVPRREMLARYGITLPEFAEMVNVLLGGETVSTVYDGGRVFDLTLRLLPDDRSTMERIAHLTIDAGGRTIPLSHVAEVVSTAGPNTINRENVSRKVVISANVAGRDVGSVVADIRRTVQERITLPEGCRIEYGGQFESEQAASRTLLLASLCALVVIFLLLYSQFRNVRQAGIIMLGLPLSVIGGVLGLWLSDGTLSIPALIGFISLCGIATRGGMLLMSRYNDLHAAGLPVEECVLRGSADRLNPILMTALTSALALLPLVVGGELPGNEIQSPMARVILGGLFTSTLLNILVTPIIYLLTHRKSCTAFS